MIKQMVPLLGSFCLLLGLHAENLIKNGDFNAPLTQETRFENAGGVGYSEVTVMTDEQSQEKYLQILVTGIVTGADGVRSYNGWLRAGGTGESGRMGAAVSPNTEYSFSCRFRSNVTVSTAMIKLSVVQFSASEPDKPVVCKEITIDKISEKEWITVNGTFKSAPNAVQAAICINLYGSTQWGKDFVPPVNSFLQIDKISLEAIPQK